MCCFLSFFFFLASVLPCVLGVLIKIHSFTFCFVDTTLYIVPFSDTSLSLSLSVPRISNNCPECNEAPHDVNQLFNCQANPTNLTPSDLWNNPIEIYLFFNENLDSGATYLALHVSLLRLLLPSLSPFHLLSSLRDQVNRTFPLFSIVRRARVSLSLFAQVIVWTIVPPFPLFLLSPMHRIESEEHRERERGRKREKKRN